MSVVDYVISARNVRSGAFGNEPGPIRYLRVPRAAKAPKPDHAANGVTRERAWLQEIQGLADGDQNPLSISPRGDVVVFIHGYNNSQETVIERHRLLAADLKAEKWRGIVVSFDWPSADSTLNYLEDRSDAAEVAVELVKKGVMAIHKGQQSGCETNIHLLGHSTGAYVIMEAFVQAEKNGELFKGDWRVGQVGFIGADVSSASLDSEEDWSRPMFRRIMRLTNYSNPYDSVLAVSNAKRLGVAPRAGRVGLPPRTDQKAVNVDCGDYFQTLDPKKAKSVGTFNHSWHIGNRVFARDFAMTMEGAIDRHALPTRKNLSGKLILQDKPRPAHAADWGIEEVKAQRGGR